MVDFFYSQSAAQLQSNMDKVSATTGDLIDTNNLDSNVSSLGYIKSTIEEYAHFRDEKASGTNGGSSVSGFNVRVLNTTVVNNITGCSLASNQITLAAGDYYIRARAPAYRSQNHRTTLYNTSTTAVDMLGSSAFCSMTDNVQADSFIQGKLTVAASHVFELQHYTSTVIAATGLGVGAVSGQVEIFAELEIRRLT